LIQPSLSVSFKVHVEFDSFSVVDKILPFCAGTLTSLLFVLLEGIEKFMKKLSPAKLFNSSEDLKQRKLDGFLQKNNNHNAMSSKQR